MLQILQTNNLLSKSFSSYSSDTHFYKYREKANVISHAYITGANLVNFLKC